MFQVLKDNEGIQQTEIEENILQIEDWMRTRKGYVLVFNSILVFRNHSRHWTETVVSFFAQRVLNE